MSEQLWSYTTKNKPSYSELEVVSCYLLHSLSEFVGTEVVVTKRHFVEGESLVIDIRSQSLGIGPFEFYWEGVILFGVRESGPAIHVELFHFINSCRVRLLEKNGSSIFRLTATKADNLGIRWVSDGWSSDEFGEWDYRLTPIQIDNDAIKTTFG